MSASPLQAVASAPVEEPSSAEPGRIPLIVRGRIVEDDRPDCRVSLGNGFTTVDVGSRPELLLAWKPADMSDLTGLTHQDVVDYLDALGRRITLKDNAHLQRAYEISRRSSRLSDTVLKDVYERLPELFRRESVQRRARALLDIACLDGWMELPAAASSLTRARMRAFGARTLHIVAGNVPAISAVTIVNNALTQGDAIIKSPSNDPMTAAAIARTMIDTAPDHPLTRHLTVAYWKGGDARIERRLYDPRHIEKIVAWGGLASIRHITRELPVGVDLITLDPKQGVALIDAQALRSGGERALRAVAERLALDIGTMNQEACFNTRLVYMIGHGDPQEIALAGSLARLTFASLQALPQEISGPHPAFDPELKAEIDALRLVDGDHQVVGGRTNEGAIIVSGDRRPVEFAHRLGCRVANIVPVGTLEAALAPIASWAQTVAVYPESLKLQLRDRLARHGVQRIVPLGRASIDPDLMTPQDGMELLRRMCKWIVEESES